MKFLILLVLASSAWGLDADESAERHFQAGLQMLAQSRFKDAAVELDVASQLEPQRGDIKDALVEAKSGHKPDAAAASPTPELKDENAVAAAEAKKKAEPVLAEAKEAYRLSELDHARDAWNRALLLDKESAEAKQGLAKLALEAYHRDADQPFDSSVADLYEEALRQARKERYVEARKKLEEALSLNPTQSQVKGLLAQIESGAFAQQGSRDADEAMAEAERALSAGDWAAARQALDNALRLRPRDAAATQALARLHEKAAPDLKALLDKAAAAQDFEIARLEYQKALAIEPDEPRAQAGLKKAQARLQAGQAQASVKQRADDLYNSGVEAWQAGRLGEAAVDFKETLALVPGDEEARKALDTVRSKLALQSDKDKAASAAVMKDAAAFEDKGQLKEALNAWQRAATMDSGNTLAASAVTRLAKQLQGP